MCRFAQIRSKKGVRICQPLFPPNPSLICSSQSHCCSVSPSPTVYVFLPPCPTSPTTLPLSCFFWLSRAHGKALPSSWYSSSLQICTLPEDLLWLWLLLFGTQHQQNMCSFISQPHLDWAINVDQSPLVSCTSFQRPISETVPFHWSLSCCMLLH